MIWELVYTSAPRGLHPGTTGFCTVAATRGISDVLAGRLEELSGYRELFPPSDPNFSKNPVAWSHVRLAALGRTYHVLSRVAAAPAEHTGRTNKLAHHLALENHGLPEAGPAWLLAQPGFAHAAWNGEVAHLDKRPGLPNGHLRPAPCRAWERATGDAGWAGWLVEQWLRDPDRPVHVLYPLGTDLLALFQEALALVPPEQRWDVTFSTYCRTAPQGVACAWRGLPLDAPEAAALRRDRNARVLVLTPEQGRAPDSAWVHAARTGQVAEARAAAPEPHTEAVSDAVPPAPPARAAPRMLPSPAPLPEPDLPRSPSWPVPAALAPARGFPRGLIGFAAGLGTGLMLMLLSSLALWLTPARKVLVSSTDEAQAQNSRIQELRDAVDLKDAGIEDLKVQLEAERRNLSALETEMRSAEKKVEGLQAELKQAAKKQASSQEDLNNELTALGILSGILDEAIAAQRARKLELARLLGSDNEKMGGDDVSGKKLKEMVYKRVDEILRFEPEYQKQAESLRREAEKAIHDRVKVNGTVIPDDKNKREEWLASKTVDNQKTQKEKLVIENLQVTTEIRLKRQHLDTILRNTRSYTTERNVLGLLKDIQQWEEEWSRLMTKAGLEYRKG